MIRIELLEFDNEYLGSGSIAQVHKIKINYWTRNKEGVIKENSEVECAVKVVKRGVVNEIENTWSGLSRWLGSMKGDVGDIWSQLYFYMTGLKRDGYGEKFKNKLMEKYLESMKLECDLTKEASNIKMLEGYIEEIGEGGVVVPKVYACSKNVMMMSFIKGETGQKMIDLNQDVDLIEATGQVLNNFWNAIEEKFRIFHGDIHPGNWLVNKIDKSIGLIDLGNIARVSISYSEFEKLEKKIANAFLYFFNLKQGQQKNVCLQAPSSSKRAFGGYMRPHQRNDVINYHIKSVLSSVDFWDDVESVKNATHQNIENYGLYTSRPKFFLMGDDLLDKLLQNTYFQRCFFKERRKVYPESLPLSVLHDLYLPDFISYCKPRFTPRKILPFCFGKSYGQLKKFLIDNLLEPYEALYDNEVESIATQIATAFVCPNSDHNSRHEQEERIGGEFESVLKDIKQIFIKIYGMGLISEGAEYSTEIGERVIMEFFEYLTEKGYSLPASFVYYLQYEKRLGRS